MTLFGYVGFILAVIIGLSLAGVDLFGLAVVSGALALGIGFGMQEIANNFVSGLWRVSSAAFEYAPRKSKRSITRTYSCRTPNSSQEE